MILTSLLVAKTALLLACVEAFSPELEPAATAVPKSRSHPHVPQPTPMLELREIDRRQEAENVTSILIPPGDLTCGYRGGNQAKPHTCYNSEACAFVSYPSAAAYFNCCDNLLKCYEDVRTTCLNLEEAQSAGLCDSNAECNITQTEHPHSVFCVGTGAPQCVTYTYQGFENGGTAYVCGPNAVATDTYLTAPLGSEREFQTVKIDALGGTVDETSSATTSSASAGGADAAADSSTAPTGDGGTQESEESKKSKDKPVGAIVGGTLGGFALVAIAGVGALFIVRKRKRENASDGKQSQQLMTDTPSSHGGPFGNTYQWQQQQQQHQQHPYEVGDAAPIEASSHNSYYELQSSTSPGTVHEVDNNEIRKDPLVEVRR